MFLQIESQWHQCKVSKEEENAKQRAQIMQDRNSQVAVRSEQYIPLLHLKNLPFYSKTKTGFS